MPVEIEMVTEDPIMVVTVYGNFNVEDAREISRFTAQVLAEHEGTIYRIHDIRAADMTFPGIMAIIKEARKRETGSSLDKRVQMLIVGRSGMFDIARAAYTRAGKNVPVFSSVQTAIQGIQVGLLGK